MAATLQNGSGGNVMWLHLYHPDPLGFSDLCLLEPIKKVLI